MFNFTDTFITQIVVFFRVLAVSGFGEHKEDVSGFPLVGEVGGMWHCEEVNTRSIGICYIGGLDANGKSVDTRTNAQKRILYQLIRELQRDYPGINLVMGHRDTSPDLNRNGVIEPCEFVKACPCFDVREFMRKGHLMLLSLLALLLAGMGMTSCGSMKRLNRQEVVCDSVGRVYYADHSVNQTGALQLTGEQMEEYIEETVLVFEKDALTVDSLSPAICGGTPQVVVKRKAMDRRVVKKMQTEMSSIEEVRDSVKTSFGVVKKKLVTGEKKGYIKGMWAIVGVVILILLGFAIHVCARIR